MVETLAPTALSPSERQERLLEAAERYMRGDIDVEAFEEAERQYLPDYEAAVANLLQSGAKLTDDHRDDRVSVREPFWRKVWPALRTQSNRATGWVAW